MEAGCAVLPFPGNSVVNIHEVWICGRDLSAEGPLEEDETDPALKTTRAHLSIVLADDRYGVLKVGSSDWDSLERCSTTLDSHAIPFHSLTMQKLYIHYSAKSRIMEKSKIGIVLCKLAKSSYQLPHPFPARRLAT